jgi:trehalose/maltose transport system substrate-binding protein
MLGNAVFMRNCPYAYALSNSDDSAVRGLFSVVPLPTGPSGEQNAATLGGWNLAVSNYSRNQDAAIELVIPGQPENQIGRAIETSRLPPLSALYEDKDVLAAQPVIGEWLPIFEEAVPRPSAPTMANYNQVSQEFWTAVHTTLSGTAAPPTTWRSSSAT